MRHQACAKGGRSAARFVIAAALTGLTLGSTESAYGQAIIQGPLSPGVVVDDASFGGAGWFPADKAKASDDMWAQAAPGGSATHYLKATDFGFTIPTPAQILGIEVLVERHAAVGTIFDSRARIVKGGVVSGADRALGGNWPTTDATVTYGTPTDLWGETWTPADINSTDFGFALSVDDNVDTAAVDHIQIRVSYTLCAMIPALGCRSSFKSILVIKDNATNSKDKVVWKWVKGASTTTAEFGNPVMGTANIALCVYDNTPALLGQMKVAPGPGWSSISVKGWKFLNKIGAQDGVQKIILKASDIGKSKALVKGKGINLPDIAPPLSLPVTVQLVNSESGVCWESVFTSMLKNQPGLFKAKDL